MRTRCWQLWWHSLWFLPSDNSRYRPFENRSLAYGWVCDCGLDFGHTQGDAMEWHHKKNSFREYWCWQFVWIDGRNACDARAVGSNLDVDQGGQQEGGARNSLGVLYIRIWGEHHALRKCDWILSWRVKLVAMATSTSCFGYRRGERIE